MRIVLVLVVLLGAACSGADKEEGRRGCPQPDWPGPWTACAEARWVEQVVEEAGYEVVGETGSALTAAGHARGFYVWATTTGDDDSEPVDDGVRTSWSAQGLTFWVESGPGSKDVKPTVEELERVVAASRRVPRP